MANLPGAKNRPSRPTTLRQSVRSSGNIPGVASVRNELLEHSRYIRDYLTPKLAKGIELQPSEVDLLRTILERVAVLPISLAFLRYSRIEKALLEITTSENDRWPLDVAEEADEILQKWEIGLGQSLEHIHADFFGPRGRLAGLKAARGTSEDSLSIVCTKSPTTVMQSLTTKFRIQTSHGFHYQPSISKPQEVFRPVTRIFRLARKLLLLLLILLTLIGRCSWFLNPPAAALAGIISTPHPPFITISPTTNLATAILLSSEEEVLLGPHYDGTYIKYRPPPLKSNKAKIGAPAASLPFNFSTAAATPAHSVLAHLRMGDSNSADSTIRVLRSHRLQSPLAPKAGIRYDGLYRLLGCGVKLNPPREWHYSFTLARLGSAKAVVGGIEQHEKDDIHSLELEQAYQRSLANLVSGVPTSDMMDDWKDYCQLLKDEFGSFNRDDNDSGPSQTGVKEVEDGELKPQPGHLGAIEGKSAETLKALTFPDEGRIGSVDSGYDSALTTTTKEATSKKSNNEVRFLQSIQKLSELEQRRAEGQGSGNFRLDTMIAADAPIVHSPGKPLSQLPSPQNLARAERTPSPPPPPNTTPLSTSQSPPDLPPRPDSNPPPLPPRRPRPSPIIGISTSTSADRDQDSRHWLVYTPLPSQRTTSDTKESPVRSPDRPGSAFAGDTSDGRGSGSTVLGPNPSLSPRSSPSETVFGQKADRGKVRHSLPSWWKRAFGGERVRPGKAE